jgi:hypothetical protein
VYEQITGEGRVYSLDTNELVADVTYSIQYIPPTETKLGEWYGSLEPIHEYKSLFDLMYSELRLELSDGRKGIIVFSRMSVSSEDKPVIYFDGSGHLE